MCILKFPAAPYLLFYLDSLQVRGSFVAGSLSADLRWVTIRSCVRSAELRNGSRINHASLTCVLHLAAGVEGPIGTSRYARCKLSTLYADFMGHRQMYASII